MLKEYPNFLLRWRLEELAAPGLPIPQATTFIANTANSLPFKCYSGSLVIPDTMPIPKQSELGQLRKLNGSGSNNSHLREWFALVDQENPNKRPLEKYVRWLRIRIYWQALLRHSEFFRGAYGHVKEALSNFYGYSYETIKTDLADMSL